MYNNITKSVQQNCVQLHINNEYYIYKLRKQKTSKAHVLILKLSNELDLRRGEKIIAISNLSTYYTWKNIKSSCNNNKSAPTRNDKFELTDGSYAVSDIQDSFEYI